MRSTWLRVSLVAALCGTLGLGSIVSSVAQDEIKPRHQIKDVMKDAHGKDAGLLKKVVAGEASDKEKKDLLDMYISLYENKPPKGEMESWHKLAGGAALAAAKVVVGRDGAIEELKTATNCVACHKVHKGAAQ